MEKQCSQCRKFYPIGQKPEYIQPRIDCALEMSEAVVKSLKLDPTNMAEPVARLKAAIAALGPFVERDSPERDGAGAVTCRRVTPAKL